MAKYYIEVQETVITTYEVDADSEDEAFTAYNHGDAVLIDEYVNETNDVWLAVD